METHMAPMPTDKASYLFAQGFGKAGIQHDEYYYHPQAGIDERNEIGKTIMKQVIERNEMLQKASIDTSTGGAGTAGIAMFPVYVDPTIVDQTRFLTPLVELVPRRANRGLTHDYNKITAKGGAKWKLDDASQLEDTDTYSRVSVAIKFGYSVGRVTGPAIAGMAHYKNAMQLDLAVKTQALKELEEDTIINGDVGTYATEFDGLIQVISTSTTNLSNRKVTLDDIDTELSTTFNNKGMVTLCVTDSATHFYIKGLLRQYQRQPAPPSEGLPFGIPGSFNYTGVNFIKSQFMPTSSASRRILFLDMRYIYMAVLQDVTYEELAKTNDSNKYMLKVYEALVVTFEGAMSQIYGIA